MSTHVTVILTELLGGGERQQLNLDADLKCAPNNLSSTVLSAFLEATAKFDILARVRPGRS